jgi:tetrahydromethanopterin S-methyltransferase subunit G
LLKELKKEKAEIDQSLKTHRAKINQRIQKTLKEKIAILNIDLLTIILILLSTTTVLQILTIIYLIWRK